MEYKVGNYVKVLHTDYAGIIDIGDVLPVVEVDKNGVSLVGTYEDGDTGMLYFLNREVEPAATKDSNTDTITKPEIVKLEWRGNKFEIDISTKQGQNLVVSLFAYIEGA